MLQEMRKYSKSKVANVLLGILAISFVSWGVGDVIRASNDSSVVKVGGTAIDQNDFRRDYANTVKRVAQQRGEATLTPDEARQLKIADQVLEQKVNAQALDNVVKKLGLTASDAMITTMIQRLPAFAGLTGQFDRATFERVLAQNGLNEQIFIAMVRSDTARSQLLQAVEGGFRIPQGYAKLIYAFLAQVRAVDYVAVDDKALGTIRTPSDAELNAYIKAHAGSFSTPEYRDVTYGAITPEDIVPTIKVSDDQIKQAYNDAKDIYNVPEKRDVLQLLFTKEAAAKAAYDKAQKGGFEQLTSDKGTAPTPQTALTPADLDATQAKAVFAAPKDGVTAPIKTAAGAFVIYKVTAITPGIAKSLESVKDELRTKIAHDLAISKLSDISNAYTDASSGGQSLTDAAKKVGMKTGRINAIDANGLGPDGQKAAAPDDQEFRNIAFHAEAGEEGDPQAVKSGAVYVVLVNSVTPPKLKPLDQVRDKALAGWTAEERIVLLKKKAAELAAQANRDHSLDGIAKTVSATVQKSPALNRGSTDDTFSPELLAQIFRAKPGETVVGPKTKGGGYVVARVTGIVHPPLAEKGPANLAIVRELSGQVGSGITESYVAQERADQGVKYNRKNVDAVVGGEAQ